MNYARLRLTARRPTQECDSLTLNYFGITSLPGISFTIVPEPTTAALVALGLGALAAGRRRRPR